MINALQRPEKSPHSLSEYLRHTENVARIVAACFGNDACSRVGASMMAETGVDLYFKLTNAATTIDK
jgi:hypothetical protein